MSWGRVVCGVVVAVLCAPALVACGGADSAAEKKPSKAALSCRAQWKELGKDTAPQVALQQPSALPERWNTLAATIDYYRTSASGGDCGERLDEQEKAIAALKSFSAKLTSLDMQAQLDLVRDDAQTYAAGPWPPAPSASPTPSQGHKPKKKAKKPPAPPRPPKPALVGAALRTLTSQAPVASQQQRPGWQQASVVDLDDTAAVAKAIKDLRFLSTESPAWRACQVALATIRAALSADR